jgi:hypothetical protein
MIEAVATYEVTLKMSVGVQKILLIKQIIKIISPKGSEIADWA